MKKIGLLALLSLSACGPLEYIPDDLTYVGMHFDAGAYAKSWKNYGELVEVEVKTNLNYQSEVINRRFGNTAWVDTCDNDDGGSVGGGSISRMHNGERVSLSRYIPDNSPPPYTYYFDFFTYGNISDSISKKYDLRERPRDLCVRFGESAYFYSVRSNVVRIPKEELVKLYASQPRQPISEMPK